MNDRLVLLVDVRDLDLDARGAERATVRHLAARFGVEGRAVQNQLDLVLPARTPAEEREMLGHELPVAQEIGVRTLRDLGPGRARLPRLLAELARRAGAPALLLHRAIEALAVHLDAARRGDL